MQAAQTVRQRTYWALFALLLLVMVGVAWNGWILLVIGVVLTAMQFGLPGAVYAFPRAFQRRRAVMYEGREYHPEELPPATQWAINHKSGTGSAVGALVLTYVVLALVVALATSVSLLVGLVAAVVFGVVAGDIVQEKMPGTPRWNQAVTAGFTYAGRAALLAMLIGVALQLVVARELTEPHSVCFIVAVVGMLLRCAHLRRGQLEQARAPMLPA